MIKKGKSDRKDKSLTAIEWITSEIERDSYILNAIADIISQADNFDIEAALGEHISNRTCDHVTGKHNKRIM